MYVLSHAAAIRAANTTMATGFEVPFQGGSVDLVGAFREYLLTRLKTLITLFQSSGYGKVSISLSLALSLSLSFSISLSLSLSLSHPTHDICSRVESLVL